MGQTRLITAYSASRIATISPDWDDVPDSTSAYKVIPTGRAIVESISSTANTSISAAVWAHASGATATTKLTLIEKILRNKTITDPTTGVMTVYDDDGSILLTADLKEDAAGGQSYRGQGAERRERLI